MMTPEQILAQQATIARYQRQQAKIQQQEAQLYRTQHSATILGFNASLGQYRVRLEDGSVVYARSISSSGSKGKGDVVSLYRSGTGEAFVKWI